MRSGIRNVRREFHVAAFAAVTGCSGISSEPSRDKPGILWSQSDNTGARMLPYADAEVAVFATNTGARVRAFDAERARFLAR